ncbi:AMP-binding protein, partial [Xanthomonas sp. SHU 199]|uniref:AMP-binding protein n=1 Tax=Xanthomonas sp. SHU 199 TaxID=1591174 RepID=UPI000584948F
QPLSRIDLLAPQERQLLLETWNQTAAPYPDDRCLHQLFEEQVQRSPHATALVLDTHTLSYAALNAQANQLAHHLIAQGLCPDGLVALCVQRSFAMVVGLLAILKAGGA